MNASATVNYTIRTGDPLRPEVAPAIHACHSAMREVEVLHDQLLALLSLAFAEDFALIDGATGCTVISRPPHETPGVGTEMFRALADGPMTLSAPTSVSPARLRNWMAFRLSVAGRLTILPVRTGC